MTDEVRSSRSPLRIALLCWQFPTFSESFISDSVRRTLQDGHSIDLYRFQRGDESLLEPLNKFMGGQLNFFDFDLPSHPAARLRRAAAHMFELIGHPNLIHTLNPFRFGGEAISLRLLFSARLLRKSPKHYDIIHAHFADIGAIAASLREMGFLRGPLLTTVHGRDITSYPLRHGTSCYDRLFKLGDAISVNSNYTWQRVTELAGKKNLKIVKIPLGVDCDEIQAQTRTAVAGEPVKFVSVGRLVEKKGMAYAISALSVLIAAGFGGTLDIIGDGPLRPELEALAKRLQIRDKVTFHGALPHREVLGLYRSMHISLHSSVTAKDGDTEGQGIALLEAQASGIPVIATNHNGFPESLQEGVTGVLVPEKDSMALAAAMKQIGESPHRWAAMGRAGADFVRSHFNQTITHSALIDLYSQLAQGRTDVAQSAPTRDRGRFV